MSAPLVTGSGTPVTVVAHGLGGSPADTRPLVSGVGGTKVFPSARGHGGVPLDRDLEAGPLDRDLEAGPLGDGPLGDGPLGDGPLDYDLLGRDLEAVADAHGATQALGVSMGAGALLSLLARRPDRFARVVLLLPAAVDRPRDDAAVRSRLALADALDAGDTAAVTARVAEELPEDLHAVPGVPQYLAARAAYLLSSPGFPELVRALPRAVPVRDRSVLGAVTAEVLLLAQEDDPLHPAQVARDLAAVLPRARLVVFDDPGAVVRERARLRSLVREFLG